MSSIYTGPAGSGCHIRSVVSQSISLGRGWGRREEERKGEGRKGEGGSWKCSMLLSACGGLPRPVQTKQSFFSFPSQSVSGIHH